MRPAFSRETTVHIRVINPNTTASMTDKIGACASRVAAGNTQIHVSQPDSGPVSIESHFDEAISAVGVLEEIRRGEAMGVDAYVIACFGDPGLLAARDMVVRERARDRARRSLDRSEFQDWDEVYRRAYSL